MQIRVEWKPADCWIGAFWRTRAVVSRRSNVEISPQILDRQYDLWICVIPMLPLHLTWFREEKAAKLDTPIPPLATRPPSVARQTKQRSGLCGTPGCNHCYALTRAGECVDCSH